MANNPVIKSTERGEVSVCPPNKSREIVFITVMDRVP